MRWLVFIALVAGCGAGTAVEDDPRVDFSVGGLRWHASSGAAVKSGASLTLYVSDQVDTCAALVFVPRQTMTVLSVKVPATDSQATVGPATGSLVRSTAGVKDAELAANSGSLSWTLNSDGSVALHTIDLGFAGTVDRLVSSDLALSACSP